MDSNLTVLVTGGAGYLGSVLVPMLLDRGDNVRVLDRFFWGKRVLAPYFSNPKLTLLEADTRNYPEEYLAGVDVVIDLASLSNDPIGELEPQKTLDINYRARVRTAGLAKKMGVKRYILASSCSVYGFQEGVLDETSPTSPVTTYARASELAEQGVLQLNDPDFVVTVLRQGTLYGLSPRLRFDLVLNTMALSFYRDHIVIQGGEQWRPIVHVADSASAFVLVSKADPRLVGGEIFNVGSNAQNYQVGHLAAMTASALGNPANIVTQDLQTDFRSYRVSFDKIAKTLGYQTQRTPKGAAQEIYTALAAKRIDATLETRTVEWYKHLLSQDPHILEAKEPVVT